MVRPGKKPFRRTVETGRFAIPERWTYQGALDAHARLQSTQPPLRPELRTGNTEHEDYAYNRTQRCGLLNSKCKDSTLGSDPKQSSLSGNSVPKVSDGDCRDISGPPFLRDQENP